MSSLPQPTLEPLNETLGQFLVTRHMSSCSDECEEPRFDPNFEDQSGSSTTTSTLMSDDEVASDELQQLAEEGLEVPDRITIKQKRDVGTKSVRLGKLLSNNAILDVCDYECACTKRRTSSGERKRPCIEQFGPTSDVKGLVYTLRSTFLSLNEAQSRQDILQQLVQASFRHPSGEICFKMLVSGVEVCFPTYRSMKGWSTTRSCEMKRFVTQVLRSNPNIPAGVWNSAFEERSRRMFNTSKPTGTRSALYNTIRGFLMDAFTYLDMDPTQDKMYTDFSKRKEGYEMFIEAQKHANDPLQCTLQYFLRVWKAEFPYVQLRRSSRFAKCSVCVQHVNDLRSKPYSERRNEIWAQWMPHLQLQAAEREKYHNKRRKAMKQPKKYLSIISDGADTDKTLLPHFPDVPKGCEREDMVQMKLQGVYVHGRGLWLYCVPPFVHNSADLVISTLHRTLQEIPRYERPPKLYLQVDGASNNKNKYMLAYATWLVDAGIVEKVKIAFLMVGHTHEDIDQCFSVISRHSKTRTALTPGEFKQMLAESFLPEHWDGKKLHAAKIPVYVRDHYHNWDVKAWLGPSIDPKIGQFRDFVHEMRFAKGEESSCIMHYKERASTGFWKPSMWQGELVRVPVTHPEGHKHAGEPVRHPRYIRILTLDLQTCSPESWEPHDELSLPEGSIDGLLPNLLTKLMPCGVPMTRRADFECAWTAWIHEMKGVMASSSIDPRSSWSIEPRSDPDVFSTAPLAGSELHGGPSAPEYSDSWEPVTFTGHSSQKEGTVTAQRRYQRSAVPLDTGTLLAIKKVAHLLTVMPSNACLCPQKHIFRSLTYHCCLSASKGALEHELWTLSASGMHRR